MAGKIFMVLIDCMPIEIFPSKLSQVLATYSDCSQEKDAHHKSIRPDDEEKRLSTK